MTKAYWDDEPLAPIEGTLTISHAYQPGDRVEVRGDCWVTARVVGTTDLISVEVEIELVGGETKRITVPVADVRRGLE